MNAIHNLRTELEEVYAHVECQIDVVKQQAHEYGCTVFEVRTDRGDYVMTPLLHTKAMVLSSLIQLDEKPSFVQIVNPNDVEPIGRAPSIRDQYHRFSVQKSDSAAIGEITRLLSAQEWDADTLDAIAGVIRATGRTIKDVGE